MSAPINNMRVHFYGVQGSGSVFPSKAEREETRRHADLHLLQQVFDNLATHAGPDGTLAKPLTEILGGEINRKTLERYRGQFDLPEQRVYGGWTTCVRIETADGYEIVLDCGSGFRLCAGDIAARWGNTEGDRHLYIFGSHAHFDHTEGFDQAAVCFDPRNHIHIAANREYLAALDQNLGIFSHEIGIELQGIQTPLNYQLMPANFDSCEIRDLERKPSPDAPDPMVGRYHHISEPFVIGQTVIQPFEVFHPDPCIAYRIAHGGKVFVFCTDHELRRGEDPNDPLQVASIAAEQRLIEQSMGADLLYRDGQYLQIEYDGHQGIGSDFGVSRLDWGHSCLEDVMAMAEHCQVKRTLIGHHDPNRTWTERNWIDQTLARASTQTGFEMELARAETVVDL